MSTQLTAVRSNSCRPLIRQDSLDNSHAMKRVKSVSNETAKIKEVPARCNDKSVDNSFNPKAERNAKSRSALLDSRLNNKSQGSNEINSVKISKSLFASAYENGAARLQSLSDANAFPAGVKKSVEDNVNTSVNYSKIRTSDTLRKDLREEGKKILQRIGGERAERTIKMLGDNSYESSRAGIRLNKIALILGALPEKGEKISKEQILIFLRLVEKLHKDECSDSTDGYRSLNLQNACDNVGEVITQQLVRSSEGGMHSLVREFITRQIMPEIIKLAEKRGGEVHIDDMFRSAIHNLENILTTSVKSPFPNSFDKLNNSLYQACLANDLLRNNYDSRPDDTDGIRDKAAEQEGIRASGIPIIINNNNNNVNSNQNGSPTSPLNLNLNLHFDLERGDLAIKSSELVEDMTTHTENNHGESA